MLMCSKKKKEKAKTAGGGSGAHTFLNDRQDG